MNLNEKRNILYNFPEIELSYEKKFHNKVQNIDLFLTIPYGNKFFAWFYSYKQTNMLIILKIDKRNNKITSIQQKICCFKSNLCIGKGTIFYGTIFNHSNINFFNIEDIHYYKNSSCKHLCNLEKFKIIYKILKNDIKQIVYQENDIIFGLPIMSNNYLDIYKNINKIPYKLYSIQHRFLKKPINIFYNKTVEQHIECFAFFKVSATIQPDIYLLECYDNKNKLIVYGKSHISSYKNSVHLNTIFRNIKENHNLDLLEESDDEDEFENISLDKYINNVKVTMKCIFNKKFMSWEPFMRSNNPISLYSFISSQEK